MHTHTKFCAFCHFRNLSHVYRVCFILHKNNKTKTKLPKRSWCRQLRTAVGIINVYHLSAFCMLCYIPKCFHAQDHSNCFHFNPFPVWKWSNASQPKQNKTKHNLLSLFTYFASHFKLASFHFLLFDTVFQSTKGIFFQMEITVNMSLKQTFRESRIFIHLKMIILESMNMIRTLIDLITSFQFSTPTIQFSI